MPLAQLKPFIGINKDLPTDDLPMGAWTDGNNVRSRNGNLELMRGQIEAYVPSPGPIPITPISVFPVRLAGGVYWVALGVNKAYCTTGTPGVWTDITRATGGNYAATTDICWNGGVLNGVPVFNNGVDIPQVWAPPSTTQKLTPLPVWPSTDRAQVIRPFRNQLFALGLTIGGVYYPHRIRYSGQADPGSLPVSYSSTDAGSDAGEFDLEGSTYLVDAVPLRGDLIIYKQGSTHRATFVGGTAVYNFSLLFSTSGMLGPDCAVEIEGAHVVLTTNDVILHDGVTIKSILDKVTRDWLFKSIDVAGQNKCFVVRNLAYNEVWVCFPTLGSTFCDRALVFNYKDGTTSFRDVPNVTGGNVGPVDDSSTLTYNSQTGIYENDLRAYNQNEFGPNAERLLLCSNKPALALMDSGTSFFGLPIPGNMTRIGMSMGNPDMVSVITRLRPRFDKTPKGAVIQFRVGSSMTLDGPITWEAPVSFTVGTSFTVDSFSKGGRFLAFQVLSSTAATWRLAGMGVEYEDQGEY